MPNDQILLFAKAKTLGIPEYRKMSKEELATAIANAEGTGKSSPKKGRAISNPTTRNGSTTSGRKTAAKGRAKTATKKSTSKSSPAKSATKKSSASKGRATASKGAQVKRTATARGTVKLPEIKKTANGKRGNRMFLDKGSIDWTAESNVGQSGKRKIVLDALRKSKGDYDKTWDILEPQAKSFYPGRSKDEAEKMTAWLMCRVAYDFAYKTGQHTPGVRAGYGQAQSRSQGTRAKASSKTKTAARKPAGGRSVAQKGRGKKTAAKGRAKAASKR